MLDVENPQLPISIKFSGSFRTTTGINFSSPTRKPLKSPKQGHFDMQFYYIHNVLGFCTKVLSV